MLDRALVIVVFVALGAAFCWLYVLAMLTVAKVRRIAIVRGAIGTGPTLFTVHPFGVPVRVKLVPLMSYVVPYPAPEGSEDATGPAAAAARVAAGEQRELGTLGLLERAIIASLSALLALVCALIALGPLAMPHLVLADLGVLLRGVVGPFSTAAAALDRALSCLQERGVLGLAARYTSVLLLGQLATLSNLHFLVRDRTSRFATTAMKVVPLITLAVFPLGVMWLLAITVWLFR